MFIVCDDTYPFSILELTNANHYSWAAPTPEASTQP